MKKVILSAVLFLLVGSTYAEAMRPCRVWRTRHHHRTCVKR
jgi:hypothetical protein